MMILQAGNPIQSKHTFTRKTGRRAFTLIELVFVLVLLALLSGVAIPRMSAVLGLNQKTTVLKLAGFFQRASQMAMLKGQNYRVVLDMDTNEFWVEEQTPPQTKPLLPDDFKVDDVLMEFRKEAETYMDEENIEKRKQSKYQKINAKGIEPTILPAPLYIESVHISTHDEPIREGLIYIPIASSGYHPNTIIYVGRNEEIKYSLVFPPLSSQMRINKGETRPEEITW